MRLVAGACALVTALAGCGEKDETVPAAPQTTPAATGTTTTSTAGRRPPPRGEPTEPAENPPGGDPRATALERDAAAAVRDYVAALDAADGAAVCRLLAPRALQGLELPEARGGCAASLAASIGYRDPRGLPVFEGAEARRIRVAELGDAGRSARVVATVETSFADREASIEDDLVYLERPGGRWLVAKASSTLYRAVGIAEIPPSVLAPPAP